jgi:hypothetical protein
MNTRHTQVLALAAVWTALPASTLGAPGIEEVITPAQYFDCQIAARQATVKGLQERATLANQAGATDKDKRAAGERSRHRVTLAMYACGRQDASTLGAYAHRNADELQTWLNANPQVKARLDALSKQVATISAQMPAVSPSAKR